MQQILVLNPENATDEEVKGWRTREAARAVVTDAEGRIALLHVATKGYYKLPGGGLEGDEDKLLALARECQEEIGCDIEVSGEIGEIVELRKIFNLKQTSYCYLARVKGDKGTPAFTDEERESGFAVEWLSYDEALTKLRASSTTDFEGASYIVPRDIAILEAARKVRWDGEGDSNLP